MPHWPGGAEAGPPPEGHEYMVDEATGLIVGIQSDVRFYGSIEDLLLALAQP